MMMMMMMMLVAVSQAHISNVNIAKSKQFYPDLIRLLWRQNDGRYLFI